MVENKKHFIHFENFYLSWIPKYYLDPLSNTYWIGVPLISNFFRYCWRKAFHSFWAFYLSWIPKYYQDPLWDPLSKGNLDRGSPYISPFQNGWKQNAFHSFWELLPFLNPKILFGPPFKTKIWTGVPLIFHFFTMHFIHFENFYLSWIPKHYLDPLSKKYHLEPL